VGRHSLLPTNSLLAVARFVMTLPRREFTVEWVLAVLAGATITITGCGGDDNNNNPGTNPAAGGR